eukprot:gene9022-1619_t
MPLFGKKKESDADIEAEIEALVAEIERIQRLQDCFAPPATRRRRGSPYLHPFAMHMLNLLVPGFRPRAMNLLVRAPWTQLFPCRPRVVLKNVRWTSRSVFEPELSQIEGMPLSRDRPAQGDTVHVGHFIREALHKWQPLGIFEHARFHSINASKPDGWQEGDPFDMDIVFDIQDKRCSCKCSLLESRSALPARGLLPAVCLGPEQPQCPSCRAIALSFEGLINPDLMQGLASWRQFRNSWYSLTAEWQKNLPFGIACCCNFPVAVACVPISLDTGSMRHRDKSRLFDTNQVQQVVFGLEPPPGLLPNSKLRIDLSRRNLEASHGEVAPVIADASTGLAGESYKLATGWEWCWQKLRTSKVMATPIGGHVMHVDLEYAGFGSLAAWVSNKFGKTLSPSTMVDTLRIMGSFQWYKQIPNGTWPLIATVNGKVGWVFSHSNITDVRNNDKFFIGNELVRGYQSVGPFSNGKPVVAEPDGKPPPGAFPAPASTAGSPSSPAASPAGSSSSSSSVSSSPSPPRKGQDVGDNYKRSGLCNE